MNNFCFANGCIYQHYYVGELGYQKFNTDHFSLFYIKIFCGFVLISDIPGSVLNLVFYQRIGININAFFLRNSRHSVNINNTSLNKNQRFRMTTSRIINITHEKRSKLSSIYQIIHTFHLLKHFVLFRLHHFYKPPFIKIFNLIKFILVNIRQGILITQIRPIHKLFIIFRLLPNPHHLTIHLMIFVQILHHLVIKDQPLEVSYAYNHQLQYKKDIIGSMFKKAGIKHILSKLPGARVLLRADFNVPINDGKISDLTRIKSTIPTIQDIMKERPRSLVILSHLGRPNGKPNAKYSLQPIVQDLQKLIGRDVTFLKDCVGQEVQNKVNNAKNGEIFLCENVRFHIEEEGSVKDKEGNKTKADPKAVQAFRKELSSLGNIFVNDAFGTCHRAHSSIVGIDHTNRVAGNLLKKELDFFGKTLENPERPVLVIMGGSKVNDKIKLIEKMIEFADMMIIGGGMSYTFIKKMFNVSIGDSLFDKEGYQHVQALIEKAKQKGIEINFPVDINCGKQFKPDTQSKIFLAKNGIDAGWEGMDGGPETIKQRRQMIKKAKTIIWNGPVGVIEFDQFRKSSEALLRDIIDQTAKGATSVVGGGDSVSLIDKLGVADKISHVSTGGGASLELLQGIELPGVKHLTDIDKIK